ncbi:3-deoxy-D-manno-octulosonic acid transferase [Faunimonas sp. B44]|uniref:3-deoxy-D-manno-octulosonic acid transferase n=1 Tax=Faunimonas sp. B44 TaxID=3461493 RepID=UPI004043976A
MADRMGDMALALYSGLGRGIEPFLGTVLERRARRGKEDAARRGERFGFASLPRPSGPLVWVHAASVGETNAVLPLVDLIVARGLAVLTTTGTVTSAEIAARRLPQGAFHQYVPVDTPGAVRRFLAHWRPDLAIFVESELWPQAVASLHRSAVPLVIVNGRLSERSFRSWQRFRAGARAIFGKVALCAAQTDADAERFRALGAPHVLAVGNLKFDAPPLQAEPAPLADLRKAIGERPVFFGASTHPGEEAAVVSALPRMREARADLLTIIAPRHPERGPAVAEEVEAAGLSVALRSAGALPGGGTAVYVADTIGEMGLWFRLAQAAFLGGSMMPRGGQNPIEAAQLAVPVLHGPGVENFAEIYAELDRAGGAFAVSDAAGLGTRAAELLDRPDLARAAGAAARNCVARFEGALDRTMAALAPIVTTIRGGHADRA